MKYPAYVYIFAVSVGIIIIFLPDIDPFPYVLGIFFFLSGLIFGFLFPRGSWRWGVWIAGPTLAFMLLSTLFAGITNLVFDDLVILILPFTSCLGGYLGSLIKGKIPEAR